jgi:predicted permease
VFPGDIGVVGNVGPGGLQAAPLLLKDATVGQVARTLVLLLASMTVVLLVAGANVANLFLVRAEAREREVAVRRALGAGHAGIVRYFLAESTILGVAGGLGGVATAAVAIRLLVMLAPATLPRIEEIRLDGVSLLVAAGLTLAATAAFAAIPWLRRVPPTSLHEGGRGYTASRSRFRARHLLMAGQVALALVLLVASGLVFRSFQKLHAIDLGFEPVPSLTFRIGLPRGGYATRESAVMAHQAILDRLTSISGVTMASAATALPLTNTCFTNSVLIRGVVRLDRTARPSVKLCAVAANYFEALGVRLLSGRTVARADVEGKRPVVVVNRAFVDVAFPSKSPIGEHIRSNAPPPPGARWDAGGEVTWDGAPPWLEIVGVVANTPTSALAEPRPVPTVYLPMSIAGGPDIPEIAMLGPNVLSMSYVVRSTVPSAMLLLEVRRVVDAVDSSLALAEVRTVQDMLDAGRALMAFTMVLLSVAASFALVLGSIGIYGVVSYIVSQRRGEIGVRLALGAEPGSVVRMIVRQGGLVALAGITVGLAAALAGGRLIESLLYQVSPRDPVVFVVLTLALFGVALAACGLPAWRASRIDPAIVLRSE